MKTFTPCNLDEVILAAMARAIWISAYADAADNGEHDGERASNGSDWMDAAPETPVRALLAAQTWLDLAVKANAVVCIWQLAGRALAADDATVRLEKSYEGGPITPRLACYREIPEPFAADFGHDIAMQIMGHGVSWFDDHAEFPLTLPRRECPQWADLKD